MKQIFSNMIEGFCITTAALLSDVLLTHIVEAIGFSSFGTHEGYSSPLAIAVGVTFNQVIGGFSIHDPVTQELAHATSMNNSIPSRIFSQTFKYYGSALSLLI